MKPEYALWIDNWAQEHNGDVAEQCHIATLEMVKAFSELLRVSGGISGSDFERTTHYWCETLDGLIIDPTLAQFGKGPYVYEPAYIERPDEPGIPREVHPRRGSMTLVPATNTR